MEKRNNKGQFVVGGISPWKGHNYGICRKCGRDHGEHPNGMKGKHFKHAEGAKKKISLANKGRKQTKTHKDKLSLSRKGKSKGIYDNPAKWEDIRERISRTLKEGYGSGRIKHPMLGKKHSKNILIFLSNIKTDPNYNGPDKKTRFKKGKQHHSFNNWISREPYGEKWSIELRNDIRERDNFTCQFPNCGLRENGNVFSVHHIDYNKRNCRPSNLILLCKSHHTKVNYNRKHWTEYFTDKLKEVGNVN